MKISLMIRNSICRMYSSEGQLGFIMLKLKLAFMLIVLVPTLNAGTPPKELTQVIKHFMNMESTSLEIHQVIDWRFSSNNDSIDLRMDIKAGRNFHLTISAFGMEIYVTENEMMSINHMRQQILYEDASPDALLKQLFVGGDLNDARFKREKDLEDGLRQLDFRFASDFSDWVSLSVILDEKDDLKKMILVDYDGNRYLISIIYRSVFDDFILPNIGQDYPQYQIADLRD